MFRLQDQASNINGRQRVRIDYFETSASVAKLESVKVFCSIAAVNELELHQIDVTTAFLIPALGEEVYTLHHRAFVIQAMNTKFGALRNL
jgi:Reverse transcriptase (RNA-dependent DNA polymerase)